MGDMTNWVGIILQTIAILVSVGAFIFRLHLDLKLLIQRQDQMQVEHVRIQSQLDGLRHVLIDLARQDARLANLEVRMQELVGRLNDHIKRDVSE